MSESARHQEVPREDVVVTQERLRNFEQVLGAFDAFDEPIPIIDRFLTYDGREVTAVEVRPSLEEEGAAPIMVLTLAEEEAGRQRIIKEEDRPTRSYKLDRSGEQLIIARTDNDPRANVTNVTDHDRISELEVARLIETIDLAQRELDWRSPYLLESA